MSIDIHPADPAREGAPRRPVATRRSTTVELNTRVLLVGDQSAFIHALTLNLQARGYIVFGTTSDRAHRGVLDEVRPDVVLLDLADETQGLRVIHDVRRASRVPLVVLADTSGRDRGVAILDAGADDFVPKPFGLEELFARIRAALRRSHREAQARPRQVQTEHFALDLTNRIVETPGRDVHLTPKEWGIIDALVAAEGRLVPHRELLEQVWGPDHVERTNYLRVYLSQLRKKLEPDPARPRYFVTEPRVGVRFDRSAPVAT